MKICSKCKISKELDEFGRNKWNKDGKANYCKECMKIVQKNDYEQNKILYKTRMRLFKRQQTQWYRDLKNSLKCERCGFNHPATLEFHHKDPKKKEFTIGTELYNGKSINELKKEMKKCIVLCANCHKIEHWNEEEKKYQELLKIDLKR